MPGGSPPRRLRAWLVAQLESGRFPGLVWDDAARSALRVPWQHGGRGGAKGGAAAALCKAWAEFKGRAPPGARPDPAGWKSRLRCALGKSPELREEPARGCAGGPRPYRVYRLVEPPGGRRAAPRQPQARPEPTVGGGAGAAPSPDREAPPPEEEEEEEEERLQPGDSAAAPPPVTLSIVIDSAEPLPPAQGGSSLGLRLWLGGHLCWQGWLPPGDYLLAPTPDPPAPPPGLLPRLLLSPLPPSGVAQAPPPALRRLLAQVAPGLLVASARRGLFLRRRAGGGAEEGGGVRCRAPHAGPAGSGGVLPRGELVQAFDAQRFRREVREHRAGRGPRPDPRVTLAVGQELGALDGPHNRELVLQLEQAFAQQLLDSDSAATAPPCAPLPADA